VRDIKARSVANTGVKQTVCLCSPFTPVILEPMTC